MQLNHIYETDYTENHVQCCYLISKEVKTCSRKLILTRKRERENKNKKNKKYASNEAGLDYIGQL